MSTFYTRDDSAFNKMQQVMQEIAKVNGVLIDCRYSGVSSQRRDNFVLDSPLTGDITLISTRKEWRISWSE